MIGTYIKHPVYGIGEVIKIDGMCELVYFFKANDALHDGAIEPRSCKDNHGWWFSCDEIQEMEYVPPLASLIKRRQHVLCR